MQEITNQEMSNYLNMALNSTIFQKIISSCKSRNHANNVFMKLGNALAKYYISTMDNSLEGVELVCDLFVKEYLNNSFDESFMSLLISQNAKLSGIQTKPTIGEMVNIVELIRTRNLSNPFCTHCFPGALYDAVSESGLDISCELFQEELALLERYYKTGYKVGKLCYCELSDASLSYATGNIPERIKFALGVLNSGEYDNKYEWYLNSFKNNLSVLLKEQKIDYSEYQKLFLAGKKVIDFYCASQETCIAIFRDKNVFNYQDRFKFLRHIHLDNNLRGTFIGNKITELLSRCQKEPDKITQILAQGLLELENISPDLKNVFISIVEKQLLDYLLKVGVKNYMHGGFADGYEVESGKMTTDEFSIVKCKCPSDLWSMTKNSEHLFMSPSTNEKENSSDFVSELLFNSKILEKAAKEETPPEHIENINFGKYNILVYFLSTVPTFPMNYLINSDNNTYQISLYSKKVLINRWIMLFSQEFKQNHQEMFDEILKKYKESDQYYEEDDLDEAIRWYANELFNSYDQEMQAQIIQEQALRNPSITVSFEDCYTISTGNETASIPRNILVDMNNVGRYNELYASIISDTKNKKK